MYDPVEWDTKIRMYVHTTFSHADINESRQATYKQVLIAVVSRDVWSQHFGNYLVDIIN